MICYLLRGSASSPPPEPVQDRLNAIRNPSVGHLKPFRRFSFFLRCLSIGRHLKFAEVAAGVDQRLFRLDSLQTPAGKISAAHEAIPAVRIRGVRLAIMVYLLLRRRRLAAGYP